MSEVRSNAERFLDAYAIIEHEMNVLMNQDKYVPFSRLLDYCSKKNIVISKNKVSLREYNELRNAIVHLRDSETEIIAEPSEAVTADIERIARLLSKHEDVLDYATKHVKYAQLDDSVESVYEKLVALDTTKLPVYQDGQYQGIITIELVCACAMHGKQNVMQARNLMIHDDKSKVVFMKKDESVLKAVEAFEKAFKQGNRLLAILVSEHGQKDEKPLGIITVKDLVEMMDVIW